MKLVRLLIDCGADPRAQVDGKSLLNFAVGAGATELVGALVEAGASPNEADAQGMRPLLLAVVDGDISMVEKLLEVGASPNFGDVSGATPLHRAIGRGATDIVAALLRAGAHLNERDARGEAPLELALAEFRPKVIEALVSAGARIDLRGRNVDQALERAIAADQPALLERAVADGWKLDHLLRGRWPVGQVASLYGAEEVACWLAGRAQDAPPVSVISAGQCEQPPKPAGNLSVMDLRPGGKSYPAAVVEVSGVIDTDGRFIFGSVPPEVDADLARGIRQAIVGWHFIPGQRGGRPVATFVTLPLRFGERDERVYALKEVDTPPRPLEPLMLPQHGAFGFQINEHPITISIWVPNALSSQQNPNQVVAGSEFEIQVVPEGLPVREVPVEFTVEKDGRTSDIIILGGIHDPLDESAREVVDGARFVPGVLHGHPVRTRMRVTLTSEAF